MFSGSSRESSARRLVADATSYWWILLLSGAVWILFSLAILQFNLTTVWSIAILAGIVLIMAGMTELALASLVPRLGWAHALVGVFFLGGGIVAFVWPGETFLVLARLVGWYLLFLGTFEIIESLSSPRHELWWLRLIAGVATVGIAFWAADSLDRSATLLVLWVGLEPMPPPGPGPGPASQPHADQTGRPVSPTGS